MSGGEAIRLQKILADAGLASRRDCEELIRMGEVTVNGKVAKVGDKAIPGKDHIKVSGKLMKEPPRRVVVALFKPRGVMTLPPPDKDARVDTVVDLIPKIKERVKPIGRLDTDAEGMILLTNDNELALRLNKATFEVEKVYAVKMDGHVDVTKVRRLMHGVRVEGQKTKPAQVRVLRELEGKTWLEITTTEVRNRHIRKMFEAIGRPVDKVRRESFAGISLKSLVRNQYRYLTHEECETLRKLVGLGG
ncbi:MAG: rRNA pseudouridine synthase [Bdellovibrionales bacterium]|nr:rRNA pseudouridine synthase [Bdellovibrionales bacterium]